MRVLSVFALLLAVGGCNALRIAHETSGAAALSLASDDPVCSSCAVSGTDGKTYECAIFNHDNPDCNNPKCACNCGPNNNADNCSCTCPTLALNPGTVTCGCKQLKGFVSTCRDPSEGSTCASCKGADCKCLLSGEGTSAQCTMLRVGREVSYPAVDCSCSGSGGTVCNCKTTRGTGTLDTSAPCRCTKAPASCKTCKCVSPVSTDASVPCDLYECDVSGHITAECNAKACSCQGINTATMSCTCGTTDNCMCVIADRLARTPSRTAGV